MATAKKHIEEIRRKKFSIGGEENPLIEDLHQTVKLLSAELYTKDVHFLMELIQNAEDNEYSEAVKPSLEFVITSRDITETGAPATLLIFNNEKGFSAKNINSICSAGRSTKKGHRKHGYIGEKGIGFKSVFLISAKPHIFSNGYQIRFNEEPCPYCNLGYIVPEWVEERPSLSDIKQVYGSGSALPTTTIILPLKPDKIQAVKQQLSSVHPEVLLFLSKIKQLSVREDNDDTKLNAVSSIAIHSETDLVVRKNMDAESYTVFLSANGDNFDNECRYYMWKQKFPVKYENKVERRMEVEEWAITLAFPHGTRLQRGVTSPGVYSFLPTEMVTNFPFIIQADFLLSSSRETILLDNKWNQGILECVPTAFVNALASFVKMTEYAPASSVISMFNFLPVNCSAYHQLNAVRDSIKEKLMEERIIPTEWHEEQRIFRNSREVGRLMPAFWNFLEKAKNQKVCLKNLSSHGIYVLNSSFDREEYNEVLNFLGVGYVNNEWYAKCIQTSNLVMGVSEDVYLELLLCLAENWSSKFQGTNILNIPLIKYVDIDGSVALSSINGCARFNSQRVVCISRNNSWLTEWNKEFRCVMNHFFMPKSTHEAIRSCPKKEAVLKWLTEHVKVVAMVVNDYAAVLVNHLTSDRKLVLAYAHFMYHSFLNKYLSTGEVDYLCQSLPLVDNHGNVKTIRKGVLVPHNKSKWADLMVSNPWRQEGYIELGEDYLRPGHYAGRSTEEDQFMEFLISHVGAADVPDIFPPNCGIPAASDQLTQKNTFLLLDWIKNLRCCKDPIPVRFLTSIKEGSWLRVTVNGSVNYKPPSQSFLLSQSLGQILQNGSVLVDIPLIDVGFYGKSINEYEQELKTVGVMFEYGEACKFIGRCLMSIANSRSVSKGHMFSILNFIKFLREKYLPPADFINSIKEGRWLKTAHDYRSPVESVLFDQEWKVASQISNIPFIDQNYYGEQLLEFKEELKLLGVIVGFDQNHYQLVIDNLKPPSYLARLSADALHLVLKSIHRSDSSYKLINALRDTKCLKTETGFKCPHECYLLDPVWGCLLKVFNDFPLVDQHFYKRAIWSSKKEELKKLGVVVDFDEAIKAFACRFNKRASSSITKDNVLALLSCYRQLEGMKLKFPSEFKSSIRDTKWLRTKLGDCRAPKECILFGSDWEAIYPITVLPFIDDSDKYYGNAIYEYRKELKKLGVVVEFKDGVKIIADSLWLPLDPAVIKRENVLSLLECIRILREKGTELPESFSKKVSTNWLRTYAGYRKPDQCLLFDSSWGSYLKVTDGPFINEEYYGSEIKLHKKELEAIGVTVDVANWCSLLASHLHYHSDFATIVRIYIFLIGFQWKPKSEAGKRIWIPDGSENGSWAHPAECVLHDNDMLFGTQFKVLDKHYKHKLLSFFCNAFGVKSYPSIDDHCNLWNIWERSREKLSNVECCAFWGSLMRHWNFEAEKILSDRLVKLPVESGSDEILLHHKDNVFIADDLQLKDICEKSSRGSLFVWYPQPSLPTLPRTKLLDIYRKIGVRLISESVRREELSLNENEYLKQVNLKDAYISRGLVKIILGFLADRSFDMEAEKRHEAVRCLLKLTVFETTEPIYLQYYIELSSGEPLPVTSSQMIRWDKESSKFFTQKMDRSGGQKNLIEYATVFSEVISKGVLWDREERVNELAELIKLAFLLEFNEDAVGFLLKSKNLQIFMEDEDFLSAAFPPE